MYAIIQVQKEMTSQISDVVVVNHNIISFRNRHGKYPWRLFFVPFSKTQTQSSDL